MSLRDDVVPALRALGRRPGLVIVGVALATVGALASVVATTGTVVLAPDAAGVLAPLVTVAVLVPLLPLLAGLYAPLTEPPDGVGATLRCATRAVGTNYWRLLVVAVLVSATAVAAAVLLVLLWLPLDTLVRYVRYAVADPGEPYAIESLLWLVGTALIGFSVGSVLVRFADTAAVYDDRDPRAGLRTSRHFARHHALSLAGFYLLVGAIGVGGSVLATALPGPVDPGGADPLAALLVSVPVSGLALTLVAVIQATYYRRTVAPAVEVLKPAGGPPWRRLAVVATVLLAAVGGAVVVRSIELRPLSDDRTALPDEPGAAYETALENTAATSHRLERSGWNRTAGDEPTSRLVAAVDYPDRQQVVFISGSDVTIGGYYDAGVIGIYPGGEGSVADVVRDGANWTRLPATGYGVTRGNQGASFDALPEPDADVTGAHWTVAERSAGELVLRIDDVDAVDRAVDDLNVYGTQFDPADGSYVEVVVDRERRTLARGEVYLVTDEAGTLQYVTAVEDVGSTDVDRPPALGERTLLEWFWATVYY